MKVLPPPDEVQVEQNALRWWGWCGLACRPTSPISSDWQAWWEQQQYQNRVLFLTGSRDTFQKVIDAARQRVRSRASRKSSNRRRRPPMTRSGGRWTACARPRRAAGVQRSAEGGFRPDRLPSINTALRATGVDLAFAGNSSGEATIRKTLEGAQKFTTRIDDDAFRSRAEGAPLGSAETKVVLWSDFKRNAAVNTNWPLHNLGAR